MVRKIAEQLLSPKVIIAAIVGGVLFGTHFPAIATELSVVGKIYLSLLQMCVLPILVTAVVSSLGQLLQNGEASHYFKQIVLVFSVGLTSVAIVATGLALSAGVGSDLTDGSREAIGKLLASHTDGVEVNASTVSVLGFIADMIPKNIFESISQGRNLRVLFFSVCLGLALGMIRTRKSQTALDVMDAFYGAFAKIITWFMYVLPVGMFCIFSSQTALTGIEIFGALARFVGVLYIGGLCLIAGFISVIWMRSKGTLWTVLKATKKPFMVAIGTSSSFASIPALLQGLRDLKYCRRTSDLVVPLGTSLNPLGSSFLFATIAVFMGQLYEVPMNGQTFALIVVGSLCTAIAAAGAPGAAVLGMMAIVLGPLGLPLEPAIAVVLAVLPAIDPCITAVNVIGNFAAAALISPNETTMEDAFGVEIDDPKSLATESKKAASGPAKKVATK